MRQITIQYGLNGSHIRNLVRSGSLSMISGCSHLRSQYDSAEVERLEEGLHYVVCAECGKWAGQLTEKHLRLCSGISLESYKARNPGSLILSEFVSKRKTKSEDQRSRQSEVLKARFLTEAGSKTRLQISEASKRHMDSGYREVSSARLVEMSRSPERRSVSRLLLKSRWEEGSLRKTVEAWHQENREVSLRNLAQARSRITDKTMSKARSARMKTSKIHLKFKELLVREGVEGFTTEGRVGPYEVDEANFELRIAVEIDGCFWHGCDKCGFKGVPSTLSNDKAKNKYLRTSRWHLLRLPGHLLKEEPKVAVDLVRALVKEVSNGVTRIEKCDSPCL